MLPAADIISLLVSPCINPTTILSKLVTRITNSSWTMFILPNPVIIIKARDPNTEKSIPITDLPSTKIIIIKWIVINKDKK